MSASFRVYFSNENAERCLWSRYASREEAEASAKRALECGLQDLRIEEWDERCVGMWRVTP